MVKAQGIIVDFHIVIRRRAVAQGAAWLICANAPAHCEGVGNVCRRRLFRTQGSSGGRSETPTYWHSEGGLHV